MSGHERRNQITEIQTILSDVDTIPRERLAAIWLKIPHILLAIAPDGAGVLRSSVGSEGLLPIWQLMAVRRHTGIVNDGP